MTVLADVKEMRAGCVKALEQYRGLHEKAKAEKRSMTTEERAQAKQWLDEKDELKVRIAEEERYLKSGTELDEYSETEERKTTAAGIKPKEKRQSKEDVTATEEFRSIVFEQLISPKSMVTDEERSVIKEAEKRALSSGSAEGGGYLYAGEKFNAELIRDFKNELFMRQISRVLPPLKNADSLGTPALKSNMSSAEWTSEVTTGAHDSALKFSKRKLQPHPLNKKILVSKRLISRVPNAAAIVRELIAEILGETFENAYMTGDGVEKPLGVFVADNHSGIGTSRDVSQDNTNTMVTFDGLKRAKYRLKPKHRGNSHWIFHREVVEEIALLKDGNGRYLLQDSVKLDEPDRILGRPFYESEFAPSLMEANQYVGLLGNFNKYWILDADTAAIKRYDELYAESNQALFLVGVESDAAPVLEEAFARVQLAA